MSRSDKERVANVSTGDITVDNITETLAADTIGGDYQEVQVGTHNIAAGAYKVRVKNSGVFENITVNGNTVSPSQEYILEAHENRTTGRLDLCPAVIVVVPASGRATYQTQTPSA